MVLPNDNVTESGPPPLVGQVGRTRSGRHPASGRPWHRACDEGLPGGCRSPDVTYEGWWPNAGLRVGDGWRRGGRRWHTADRRGAERGHSGGGWGGGPRGGGRRWHTADRRGSERGHSGGECGGGHRVGPE